MAIRLGLIVLSVGWLVGSCNKEPEAFKLYRNSVLFSTRIHVATFDSADRAPDFNRSNCELVVRVLQQQPGVPAGYYWCESGEFKSWWRLVLRPFVE